MTTEVLILCSYLVFKPLLDPIVLKIAGYVSSFISGSRFDAYSSNTRARLSRIRAENPGMKMYLLTPTCKLMGEISYDENFRPKDASLTPITIDGEDFLHCTLFVFSLFIILRPNPRSMQIFNNLIERIGEDK